MVYTRQRVRPGCPLSGILFILCVEIMGTRIRNNPNVKEIRIEASELCSCFLKNIESIYTLIDCIKGFWLQSGLNLNSEKSILFFLRPWKDKEINIFGMKIERSTLNMFGVEIGRSTEIKEQKKNEKP